MILPSAAAAAPTTPANDLDVDPTVDPAGAPVTGERFPANPGHLPGMTDFTPNRVAAGVPAGGQFAVTERGEAGVSLREPLALSAGTPITAEQAERITQAARESARFWVNTMTRALNKSSAVDEFAQEATLHLLAYQRTHDVRDAVGFLHTKAREAMAATFNETNAHSYDIVAFGRFTERQAEMAEVMGRPLTGSEINALATQIRESYPAGQRPTKAFHMTTQVRRVSVDAVTDEGRASSALTDAEAAMNQGTVNRYVEPDSYLDRALSSAEDDNAHDVRHAKRLLWNAIAEVNDLPMAAHSSLSQRKVTETRAVMAAYPGGVHAAAEAHLDGRADNGTQALFAPFGDLTTAEKDGVAALMSRRGEHAVEMWNSAMFLANNQYADLTADTRVAQPA